MPYEQYVAVKRAHWPAILRIIVHDMVGHVEIGKPCHHEAAAAHACYLKFHLFVSLSQLFAQAKFDSCMSMRRQCIDLQLATSYICEGHSS